MLDVKVGPPRYSLPQCPHLKYRYCTWLSNHLGKLVHATGPRCQIHCQNSGPYCGRTISNESAAKFAVKVLSQDYDEEFLARVWKKYQLPTQIGVPAAWSEIKSSLAPMIEKPYVQNVLLTGSLIVKGKDDHKDYDIAILVNNLSDFLNDNEGLSYSSIVGARNHQKAISKLPTTIAGKNVDYFILTDVNPFFATLDPERKKLYTSPYFDLNLIPEEGIEVIRIVNPAYRDEMTRVLSAIAERVKLRHELAPQGDHSSKIGLPRDRWPMLVRLIEKFKTEKELGIGDTLARVFNIIPVFKGMGAGDAFKFLMNKIGHPCKCEDRQNRLNALFPYSV